MSLLSTILGLLFLVNCFETYHVNSSSDLEQYLCNTTWNSKYLMFSLNSSINFTLSHGIFCQVTSNQTNKIDICSDSSTKWATITCVYNDTSEFPPQSRRGLAFFNTTVTLERLIFKDCGTYLTTIQDKKITDYLNSSSLHYTSSHAAALVFVHCQVNITQVNIYYSYGFAMIGVNLYNSTIDSVSMSNSSHSFEVYQHNNQSIGSGLLLHFMNTNNSIIIYDILIKNALFSYNWDYNTHSCLTHTYFNRYSSSSGIYYSIVNAAGLTILYTQQSNGHVSVHITGSHFIQNYGSFAGGMFVLQYHTIAVTNTTIANTVFSGNINFEPCHGAAIAFYWISLHVPTNQETLAPLYVVNTSFIKHQGISQWPESTLDYGAVYIGIVTPGFVHLDIRFNKCKFLENYATNTGACLFASVYKYTDNINNISITLESTIAKKNSQYTGIPFVSSAGIFYFHRIGRVNVIGTSCFSNNYGSVISSKDSNIYLSGDITFDNNHAMSGSAILLRGNCQLHFMSEIIAKFTNNWAQLVGGAIHAEGAKTHDKCVIQVDTDIKQIMFTNNEARRAGSSIYAQPIFSCYINNSNYIKSPEEIMKFYNQHFNFINNISNTTLLNFSTIPTRFREYTSTVLPQMFPGETTYFCISAIDALSRNVFSAIAIDVVRNYSQPNIPKTTKLWLSFDDQEQLIRESKNCTTISVTVHTNDQFNIIDGMIVFSQYTQSPSLKKYVKIYPCPLGFELNKITGVCELSSSFDNFRKHQTLTVPIIGNVSSKTITRIFTLNSWAGRLEYENKTKTQFGVSLTCPIGYCDSNHTLFYFYSGDLSSRQSFKLSDGITDYHPPLCLYQREGTLCGRCSEGLSVVFGSKECRHCSNTWIASISIYLVAGPLLIYLLYALRLTLTTGTLNGIIFYAQAANCGLIDTLRLHYYNNNSSIKGLSGLTIFILNVLNLEPGISLCFYNGMTELWKTGFKFALPIYYLTIVVVLIIFCHFSSRLSNRIAHSSVQVLVTVVHLSFSSLLIQLINVVTYAEVYTSNDVHRVWYLDGNVKYGGHTHRILMIVTLIVVPGLLLPYVFLLLFSKPLRPLACTNKYLRPLLEAIHAPYKEGKQYWFTLRLLLLCAMYGIYAFYRATNVYIIYITTSPMLVIFLVLQAYIKPFKNTLVNILDCWLMMNFTFLYLTTWYFILEDKSGIAQLFCISSVILTLVTFIIVIVYHIVLVTGKVNTLKGWIEDKYEKVCCWRIKMLSSHTYNHQISLSDASYYGSCSEFREPLLGHSD